MKRHSVRLVAAIAATLALAAGCTREAEKKDAAGAENADAFVARVNREMTDLGRDLSAAGFT